MGLWAEATIHIKQPKVYNVKDKLNKEIKSKFNNLDEFIIDSTFTNDEGLIIGVRTCLVGEGFNDLIDFAFLKLKQMNVGHFYIHTQSNYHIA